MKIISWNVNGIRALIKNNFFESIEKLQPDVLCLQETKAQKSEVEKAIKPLIGYTWACNSALKKGYSGVAIGVKIAYLKVIDSFADKLFDQEGRIVCTEFKSFYLLNVYKPNSGQKLDRLAYRKNWDADFLAYAKELEKVKPLVICGDFNVAHQPIDLKNPVSNYNKTAGYTQIEIDGMTNLLDCGFIDAFRYFYPEQETYTFWSYRFNARAKNIGWRIDYFLVSKSLLPKIKSISIHSDIYGSDHCPVELNIQEYD